ncbi:MAG: RNA polymerase sigma factor [Longimicrobiales bacterium]
MMEETDAELVAAVRNGSRAAAATLAERYLRASRAVALSIVHDIAGAEDVCQDAFVYAIERIDDCRHPARFSAWLLQIVRNRSRNYLRDSKASRSISIDNQNLPSRHPSPERLAERSEIRERLLVALRELPEDRKTVLLLHDLEGWAHHEIAEHLGLPSGTVRSHLHYARKRLRELLRELKD